MFYDPSAITLGLQSFSQKLLSTLTFKYILNIPWGRKNFKRKAVYRRVLYIKHMQPVYVILHAFIRKYD